MRCTGHDLSDVEPLCPSIWSPDYYSGFLLRLRKSQGPEGFPSHAVQRLLLWGWELYPCRDAQTLRLASG